MAICGQGDPFTRVLQTLLERAGAMVTAVDVRAESIAALPSEVAALVIGEAAPAGEVWELFERVPVLLDAAYYLPPRPAGWLPAAVRERIDVHLTQYGNVGPLTVAHLAAATVTAASVRL